jgi:hypothetical protein
MKRGELSRARAALDDGKPANALFELREARRVAVAQRKLQELIEVHKLVDVLSAQSSGRVRAASERLARQVTEAIDAFPADELIAAGIEPKPDPLVLLLATIGDRALVTTPELARARAALDEGDLTKALFELRQARRVAVAQRKQDELLEVYELVRVLSQRSSGRTRTASEVLTRKVETGLRSFAQAADV